MKPKAGFLRKSTKLNKLMRGKKTQTANIGNQRGDSTTDPTDFKRILGNVMNYFMPINSQLG